MKVVVSILNWNNIPKTIDCLESLKKLDYSDLIVCVTDNNSSSFESKVLLRVYKHLVIFQNDNNLGFAAGQEQALQYAKRNKATHFWMLNNDVIVYPDTLTHLLNAYQTYGEGIYGSKSVPSDKGNSSEVIWELDKDANSTSFVPVSQQELNQDHTIKVANVVGYSFMIPLSVIKQYGFLDNSYFLYYEETDYCISLLKNGVFSYWVGASKVCHETKGSTNDHPQLKEIVEYYLYRNLFIFLIKHGSVRMIFHYLGRFMMRFLSANIARKQKVPVLTRKHILGIFHAFIEKKGKYYSPEHYLKDSKGHIVRNKIKF